jgi:hypothetical protein
LYQTNPWGRGPQTTQEQWSSEEITIITIRPRLVRGMVILLGKWIAIPRNRRRWNEIVIPILLFGCNTGIEKWICIPLFGTMQYAGEWNHIVIKFPKTPL